MQTRNAKRVHSFQSDGRVQRFLLAAFSLLFLFLGVAAPWIPLLNANVSGDYAAGTLLKVGVVLGIGWLAAPQLERFGWQRLRGTVLVVLLVLVGLFAYRPKIGLILGGLFIGGTAFLSILGWVRTLTKPPGSR